MGSCFKVIAAAIGLGLAAGAASAAVLDIASVTGTFGRTESRGGAAVSGDGSSVIDWGRAASGTANSSYRFEGSTVSTDVAGRFVLGSFTHHNGTIWRSDGTLARAELDIGISGTFGGESFSLARNISIDHTETANEGRPCQLGGGGACRDGIGLSAFDPFTMMVELFGISYALEISGLTDGLDASAPATGLITPEQDERSLLLVGALSEIPLPVPVPLPAAGALLLGSVLALGAARRRG